MPVTDICEAEKYQPLKKDFRQILIKIEKAGIIGSMDAETSNFQVRIHFYGNFQKLVL